MHAATNFKKTPWKHAKLPNDEKARARNIATINWLNWGGKNDSTGSLYLAPFMDLFSKQLTSKMWNVNKWGRHCSLFWGCWFIYLTFMTDSALHSCYTIIKEEVFLDSWWILYPNHIICLEIHCLFIVGNILVIDIIFLQTGTHLFDRDLQ